MKITNKAQFEKLVELLQENPSIAKGFHRGMASSTQKQKRELIVTELKAAGPPIRDCDGWQKVTKDITYTHFHLK